MWRCKLILRNNTLAIWIRSPFSLVFHLRVNIQVIFSHLYLFIVLNLLFLCRILSSQISDSNFWFMVQTTEYEDCMLRCFLFALTGFSKHNGVHVHSCYGMKYLELLQYHTWILNKYWFNLAVDMRLNIQRQLHVEILFGVGHWYGFHTSIRL